MSIHIPNNSVQLSFQFACAGVTDPIVTTLGVNIDTPPKTVQEVCDTVKPLTIGAGKWLDPTQTSTSWTLLRIDGAKNVAGDISFGTAVCNTPALFHSDEDMQFTEIHSFVVMSLLATQRRRMR